VSLLAVGIWEVVCFSEMINRLITDTIKESPTTMQPGKKCSFVYKLGNSGLADIRFANSGGIASGGRFAIDGKSHVTS
jgi:hypothetical protein